MDLEHELSNFNQDVGRWDLIEVGEDPVPNDVFPLESLMEKLEISQ